MQLNMDCVTINVRRCGHLPHLLTFMVTLIFRSNFDETLNDMYIIQVKFESKEPAHISSNSRYDYSFVS